MINIHHINLAAIDLNLLVVFDALMVERNVTRAGKRVGLSQPATSNALARLRSLIDDELFIRTAAGLRPTPTAIALQLKLNPALQQIQGVLLEQSTFDPATSHRVLAIGMSDYMEFTLLPRLMQTIQTIAPQVVVQIRSGDRPKLLALLDSGEIDLACGVFPEDISWHKEQFLFKENYVCVCRRNHPVIGDSLSLAEYLGVSHLLVSIQEDLVGRVDMLLAEQNLKRHIALSIPHFLTAPFILAQTDLVAALAQRIAVSFVQHQDVKLLPMPFPITGFSVFMRWHHTTETSPACQWLRSVVLAVTKLI
jgi:LysR family transcriptional regulator, mexEF-oprN operon transcriptional activator